LNNTRPSPAVLLLISYFAFVVIGMPLGVLNIAWTYMQPTFEVPLSSLGVLLALATLGQLVISFTSGRLIARMGLGLFMLGGTMVAGLGMLGHMFSPSWPTLLVAVLFGSMGGATLDVGLNIFVSSNYSTGRLNWLHAAFGVGVTLGPIVATHIIVTLDQTWRWAYACILILQIVLAVCLGLTFKHWNIKPLQDGTARPVAGVLATLRVPAALLLLALFFFYGGVEIGTGQLANTLFIGERGFSQSVSSFWISVYWASFTVGRALIGIFVDRMSAQGVLRLSMIGVVTGAALLWQNIFPPLSLLGVALLGFAQAPMFPTLVAETSRYVDPRFTPTLIGFEVGFTALGGALLPGLGSVLAERAGLGLISPFILAVAVVMVMMYVALNLHRSQSVAAVVAAEH
jgi:fucose permease